MKPRIVAILAFLTSACLGAAPAGADSGKFSEIIKPYVDKNAAAGAVFLVADAEKTLACEAAGLADIASQKPMRTDAVFWIASMTKSMTAACLMMLVDEGKVALDDPVEKYIPEFAEPQKISPAKKKTTVSDEGVATAAAGRASASAAAGVFRKRPITLRQLLSHTAGMQRTDPRERFFDTRPISDAAARHARLDLLFEPGASYSYSSLDIGAIGRVIEVAGGIPYEKFLQTRLLDPLGMNDTTFWPDKSQLARLATSYRGNPEKHTLTPGPVSGRTYPLDDRARRHPTPGGGLFSTAADVAKFGQLLLNKGSFDGRQIISEKSVAEMARRQTPPVARTAYGLCLLLGAGGRFGHGGAHGTNFTVWPREKRVTVYMVQRIVKYGAPDGEKLRPALEKAALEF
ncbi:MAG: beta-lactamase family protein [Opitutaceae bacterium]|nr:beta-lactamase family protein [Opitutaceae bacterium]